MISILLALSALMAELSLPVSDPMGMSVAAVVAWDLLLGPTSHFLRDPLLSPPPPASLNLAQTLPLRWN